MGGNLRPICRRDAEPADRRGGAHRAIAGDGAGAGSGRCARPRDAAPDRGVSGVSEGTVPLESRQPRGSAVRHFVLRTSAQARPAFRRRPLGHGPRSHCAREQRARSRPARSWSRRACRRFDRSRSTREFPTRISRLRRSAARSNGTGAWRRTNTGRRSRCRPAASRRTGSTRSFLPPCRASGKRRPRPTARATSTLSAWS